MAKLSLHSTGRKAGIWYIDCTINGRRARKALGRDETVARQRFAQLVATLELEAEARRQSSTQEDPPLRRLADWYVEELMAARGNRESSRDLNHRKLKRWVVWCNARRIETYGDLCNQVTAIDAYAAHLLETLAPSTTRQHLATIKAVLDQAERRKLVPHRFPLSDWPRPRVAPPTYDVTLTVDQFHAILAAVGTYYPHYLDAVTFLAYVGCRPSDVAALRWSSVHFLTQTAEILQVKTAQPVTIQLAPQAVAALRRAFRADREKILPSGIQPRIANWAVLDIRKVSTHSDFGSKVDQFLRKVRVFPDVPLKRIAIMNRLCRERIEDGISVDWRRHALSSLRSTSSFANALFFRFRTVFSEQPSIFTMVIVSAS